MIEWLLYNVIISLLPVGLLLIFGWLIGKFQGLFTIIRDGQLCFYCTTTAASLIEDLSKKGALSGAVLAGLILLIIFSTFVYGAAVATKGNEANTSKFGWTSLLTCVLTITLVIFVRNKTGLL